MVVVCQPYAPAAFTPQEIILVLISVIGRVDSRVIVRSEGFYANEKFQWHQLGSNQRPSDLQHRTLTTVPHLKTWSKALNYVEISYTEFNTHLSQNAKFMGIKSFISLSNVKLLTDSIFMKLTLSWQLFAKNSYTELHENSTNIVEADISLQTGRLKAWFTHEAFFLLCKERLESYNRSFNRIV